MRCRPTSDIKTQTKTVEVSNSPTPWVAGCFDIKFLMKVKDRYSRMFVCPGFILITTS